MESAKGILRITVRSIDRSGSVSEYVYNEFYLNDRDYIMSGKYAEVYRKQLEQMSYLVKQSAEYSVCGYCNDEIVLEDITNDESVVMRRIIIRNLL